jgi:hypothetical protein
MLDIETFDNLRGGSVLYKALVHPVAAQGLARLAATLNSMGRVALYDPDAIAAPLLALSPRIEVEGIYVHDTMAVGHKRAGQIARPLTRLRDANAASVLVASFGGGSAPARITQWLPAKAQLMTLDQARLPAGMITNATHYLDPLNFATNFAFFRDDDHFGTRLTTANYWARYGAHTVKLFLRLYDEAGNALAEWEQRAPSGAGGLLIDSAEVRRRFALRPFTGQLFMHAIGIAGHDILKYALDTYATDGGASLSCTHDANAWPAERYAGLPAPSPGERVTLWLQNSHALPIPAGAITLDRMGADAPVAINEEIGPFATRAIDVSRYLPQVNWPSQIEVRAGRHVMRPRYEVTRNARTRIAHVNVERSDLRPDPQLKMLSPELGRGYLLPFPILPRTKFRTIVQPNPMAVSESNTPLRLELFATDGSKVAERYLGVLPRNHDLALDLDTVIPAGSLSDGGHAELLYDFREGGDANGWMHALFRYEQRDSGHVAESSFGSHMFNTIMTYRHEPQSYAGPPPGLSTRLYLKLATGGRRSFCVLIYPASAPWHAKSSTLLELHSSAGDLLETQSLEIACSGSASVVPSEVFRADKLGEAGESAYMLVRDTTCRLFGFHGEHNQSGSFSFDHMFGF